MLDIDLTNDDFDPAAARKGLANGGVLPPGRYHARLIKAEDKTAGQTSFTELTFAVAEGMHAGSEFRAKLWNSDKTANGNRHKLVMCALGMLVRGPGGKGWQYADGLDTYADAAAAGCECVVEVEHDTYSPKNGGKDVTQPLATFNGFWSLGDPEVKAVKKAPAKPKAAPQRAEVDADAI